MKVIRPLTIATLMLGILGGRKVRDTKQLVLATGGNTAQVGKAARHLIEMGYLKRARPGCFQLTAAGERAAATGEKVTKPRSICQPNPDSVISRAWRALRVRRAFTVADLICDVQRGSDGSKSQIQHFCTALERGGYLQGHFVRGASGGRFAGKAFRLCKDTGPKPPRYFKSDNTLYDFNTGEVVKCAT